MLCLAFDTAGQDCSVAVARTDGQSSDVLARRTERIGRGHAEALMPMIEAVLAETDVALNDIAKLAVTTGPGSFTGVRVGLAAARGLALALDIPAIGVGSLDALARPLAAAAQNGTLVAALDARRNALYAQAQDLRSGARLIGACAIAPEALAQRLAMAEQPLILTGSGAPILAEALNAMPQRPAFDIAGAAVNPEIDDVVALALTAPSSATPVPLYARAPDAKPQHEKAVARQ